MTRRVFVLGCAAVAALAFGQELRAQSGFVNRVFKDDRGSHRYVVYLPPGYSSRRKWPVVLFLHGAGERGTDGLRPTTVGLGAVIRHRRGGFPAVVVFPQCENLGGRILTSWNAGSPDGDRALKILADVESQYSIDPARRALTGWSMGGAGVWSLAAKSPRKWAAIVPMAGGGDPKIAANLNKTRIWAFHGAADPIVRIATTRNMIEAVRKAGGKPAFTTVTNIGHDVWKAAYSYPPLVNWLKDPRQPIPKNVALKATAAQLAIPTNDDLVPFVPAVEVSRAITVRLGNNALQSLAYSVPAKVPRTVLSGTIQDIVDSTTVERRNFSVQFSNISYSAGLARVRLRAVAKDRLRIQLALSNATMSIGATYVTGRRRSATAGQISVVIGHRRPVWLTIDTAPSVAGRKLKLKTVAKSFNIPADNWYVSAPAGVRTRGWGMTREKVSSGLVNGLYGSKARIESEVLAIVPNIVKELEKSLEIPDASGLLANIWPLPVYQPRVRLWPETVRVDKNGVTVQLGITAAAIDPAKAPRQPRKFVGATTTPAVLQSGNDLHVGIASRVLQPLSQLLVDGGVARIHVLDMPAPKFALFVDRKTMTSILPDLKRLGNKVELSAEFVLREPIALNSAETELRMSDGSIVISVRAAGSDWKPYAELSVRMTQKLKVHLQRSGFTGRKVRVDWAPDPSVIVKGRFFKSAGEANGRIDTRAAAALFAESWQSWTKSLGGSNTSVPDIAFGTSALRLESIEPGDSHITARFAPPGLKITNKSQQQLVYEIKGPHSGWGGPYTLKPGKHHEFEVPYAVTYRRKVGSRYLLYTLPAGSHSEYRQPRGGGSPTLLRGK